VTGAPGAAFGERLAGAFARFGHLCVGIDPHPWLLNDWGLPDSAAGAREFGLRVVEASSTRVGIVKPQVAFFERHGAAGFLALEGVLAEARDAGLLVIADAKRGDVGSSAEAYGAAWLTPGSPLSADALTLSCYLGVGSLNSVIALARQHGKGLYLLAATSNPEGAAMQTATVTRGQNTGRSVAAGIVAEVSALNAVTDTDAAIGADAIGPVGVVLGATVDLADYGIDPNLLAGNPATSILAPGFGHQGARFDQVRDLYGAAAPFTVLSVSRSVLSAGRAGLPDAIAASADEVARCLA
jgi:orotidine-5'-phosphate decarboxylase